MRLGRPDPIFWSFHRCTQFGAVEKGGPFCAVVGVNTIKIIFCDQSSLSHSLWNRCAVLGTVEHKHRYAEGHAGDVRKLNGDLCRRMMESWRGRKSVEKKKVHLNVMESRFLLSHTTCYAGTKAGCGQMCEMCQNESRVFH